MKPRDYFRILPVPAALIDHNGDLIDGNIRLAKLLGFSSMDELTDKKTILKYSLKSHMHEITNEISQKGLCEFEIDLTSKEDSKLHVLFSCISLPDPESKSYRYLALLTNLTELRKSEVELRNQKKYTDALVESLPGILFVYNQDGRLVRWNRNHEIGTGFSDKELATKTLYSWFPKEEIPKLKEAIGEVYSSGSTYLEAHAIMKDGRKVPYLFSGRKLETDDGDYLLGVGIDISERIAAEEALRHSEQKYSTLIHNGNDGIAIHDAGSLIFANEVAHKYMGYRTDEIVGEFITKFIVPEDHERILEQAQRRAKGLPVPALSETTLIRKDGSLWPVELHTKVIDFEGKKVHLVFIRDMTARKILEQQLMQASEEAIRANKAKSQFLANMSHEIRTPINAVIGLSDVLNKKVKEPELRDYVDSIRSSSQTLLGLINDILDLSKIEAGKMELKPNPMNLNKAIQEVIAIFSHRAKEKGIALGFESSGQQLQNLFLDELRIKQVIINLIGNAIKFTDHGSVLLKIDLTPADGNLVDMDLKVKDTGTGIPEDIQEKIFEAFTQQDDQDNKKYKGTGLGLSITARIVEMMKGNIRVLSQPGKGSTFHVRLPGIPIVNKDFDVEVKKTNIQDNTASETEDALEDQRNTVKTAPLNREQLVKICKELELNFIPIWRSFGTRKPIKKVAEFAKKLELLGSASKCVEVVAYSLSVQSALSSYNIERLEAKIEEFPNLISSLTLKSKNPE